jgi:hypothetical protein
MIRRAATLGACGLLAACATLTPPQQAEQADTAALTAYATVAVSVNAYEASGGDKVKGEAIRAQAWSLLQAEHAAYKAGQIADISQLVALVGVAANLGMAKP